MGSVLALASFVINNLPGWIDAGMDVYDLYTHTKAVIDDNKGPGADDWNALDAQAQDLQAKVRDPSTDAG